MGGDANKEGETDVVVTLFPNTSSSERSQELMLTNFSTKEIIRLKITQQTTSVSSKNHVESRCFLPKSNRIRRYAESFVDRE